MFAVAVRFLNETWCLSWLFHFIHWKLNCNTQVRLSLVASQDALALFLQMLKQSFMLQTRKNPQLFHILPRSSGFFLVLPSTDDDSTRQVIITLSEILQAASCCYFSLFFNNYSSSCCLPKPSIVGTVIADWQDCFKEEKGFARCLLAPTSERKCHLVTGPCQPGMNGRLLAFPLRTNFVNTCLKLVRAHK